MKKVGMFIAMLHLNFKKAIKILIVFFTIILLALSLWLIMFYTSTIGNPEQYCKENSFRNASKFVIASENNIKGYLFAIAVNGDSNEGQELFVFKEKNLGPISNTDRYYLEYHSDINKAQTVGSYLFKPNQKQRINENFLVFYSDNKEKMSNGICITSYNENGKDITTKISFSIQGSQPFVCVTTPLKPDETVESAIFEDKEHTIIYTY